MRARIPFFAVPILLIAPVVLAQVPIPVPTARAVAFHDEIFWLWLVEQVVMLAVPASLLFSGWGAAVAARCGALARNRTWATTLLFATFVGVLYALASMAIELIREIRLAPYFEQRPVAVAGWLLEQAVPTMGVIVLLAAAGSGLNAIIRRSRRWWWLWVSSGLTIAASVYLLALPIANGQLKEYPRLEDSSFAAWSPRITSLAARAGTHDLPVLVRPTRAGEFCRTQNSAIGLGPTRAIVLADQIFSQWQPGMVDVAFAHELKHYLHDNTWLPVALIALLSGGGAFAISVVGTAIVRRLRPSAGIDSLASPAALPLLLVLLQIYLLIAIPAFHLTAQVREMGADRFALELTRDKRSRALVSASKCGDLWLAEDPLFERLYLNTHPSMAKRIRLANEYRP
jgi:STE24 endopeptidase